MTMIRFSARAIALVVLVAALSACSILQKIADRFAPPATFRDVQYASVRDNVEQASDFRGDVGVFVSAQAVDDALRNELKAGLIESSLELIRFEKLEPRVVMVPQGVVIDVDFDGLELKNRIRVRGSIQGFASVATMDDRLLIRPALGPFKLDRLRAENGGVVRPDVSALVNKAVRAFADNAAGHFKDRPIAINLGWKSALKVDIDSLAQGGSIRIDAEDRTIQLSLARSLVHIDRSGIRVLAQVDKDGGSEIQAVDGGDDLIGRSVSERQLNELFKQYSRIFSGKWEQYLDPLEAGDSVEVYLSKAMLAGLINDVSDQQITFEYAFNVPPAPFNEVVEAKKSQVDCQRIYEPFNRERYKRKSCSWSCLKCIDMCPIGTCNVCTDDPVCLANRAACNVLEEAKVAEDNIQYELELAQHKADQEVRVAACNVWREATSVLAVGRFAGDFAVAGRIEATTAGIKFDPTMSFIDVAELSARVGGSVDFSMKATPHDLGHVFFCVAPTRFDYRGLFGASIPALSRRVLITQQVEGDALVLRANMPKIGYEAGAVPPPIQAFIANPEFLAQCPFAASVLLASLPTAKVASVMGLDEGTQAFDAAMGRYRGEQTLDVIEYRIEPQRIVLSERRSIVVLPKAGARSFQLRARTAN